MPPADRTSGPDARRGKPLRTQRRIRLKQPLEATFVAGSARGKGRVYDVSLGGLFVQGPLLPAEGSSVAAALETPSGWRLAIEGVVRWSTAARGGPHEACGFGIRVTRCSNEFLGFVDGALAASPLEAEPR